MQEDGLSSCCIIGFNKEEWAEEVLKASKIKHRDTYEDMKKAGFDIAENARWLENFYLSQIKRFEMREKE